MALNQIMKFLILPLIITLTITFQVKAQSVKDSVVAPVKQQLEAYNNRDIKTFADAFADSVRVFTFPDKLLYQGKKKLFERYDAMFKARPDLHAEIVKRMVVGNTVIDEESVTFDKDAPKVKAIAIYKVHNGKITEVYFIME